MPSAQNMLVHSIAHRYREVQLWCSPGMRLLQPVLSPSASNTLEDQAPCIAHNVLLWVSCIDLLLTLTFWHRPAAAEAMSEAATTAIPAHVDVVGDDHTRYLVSVKPALVPTNSSRLLGSRGSRRSSLVQQSARQPFDDVKLGPLLGKGGFGRVYRAVWNGAAVACKVPASS